MPGISDDGKVRAKAATILFLFSPVMIALAFNLPLEVALASFIFGVFLAWLCLNLIKRMKQSKTKAQADHKGGPAKDRAGDFISRSEDLLSSATSRASVAASTDSGAVDGASNTANKEAQVAELDVSELSSRETSSKIWATSSQIGAISSQMVDSGEEKIPDRNELKTSEDDSVNLSRDEEANAQEKAGLMADQQPAEELKPSANAGILEDAANGATSLGKIDLVIEFSDEALMWLDSVPALGGEEAWFKNGRGMAFFSRYERDFERLIKDYAQDTVSKHFIDLGFPRAGLPVVETSNFHIGSIRCSMGITTTVPMEGVLAMLSDLGTFSKPSDVAGIAARFQELEKKLEARLHQGIDAFVKERLKSLTIEYDALPVPDTVTAIKASIDASPLAFGAAKSRSR